MEDEITQILNKAVMDIRKVVNREVWPTRLRGLHQGTNTADEERKIEVDACKIVIKNTMECISAILNESSLTVEYCEGDTVISVDKDGKFVKI